MILSLKRDSLKVIRLPRLSLLTLLAVTTVSFAGTSGIKELPAAPMHWSGFYAGVNGGYSWSNTGTHILPLPLPTQLPPGDGSIQPAFLSALMSGGVFGGQIGYNWQLRAYPQVYLGLETDLNWSSLKGSTSGNALGNTVEHLEVFSNVLSTQLKSTWFGTLRGRLGFSPAASLLFYGTAGLAYGYVEEEANTNFVPGGYGDAQYPVSLSLTRTGWTAGGGLEWAPKQNCSIKLEYLYYDLGKITRIANPIIPNPPFQTRYTWTNPTQVIRLGLNYYL
ncbi:MAG: outer membrane beta-barrel protein [Tatlockia sp.]|jgi:outer membrane immunogenic protein